MSLWRVSISETSGLTLAQAMLEILKAEFLLFRLDSQIIFDFLEYYVFY